MKMFDSNLTNGIADIFNKYYMPSYMLNAIDSTCFDKRDAKILELIKEIAKTCYNHGVSDALSQTGLTLDEINEIRNSTKLDI